MGLEINNSIIMYVCVLKKKKLVVLIFLFYIYIFIKKNLKNVNILFNDIIFGDVFI